MWRWSSIPLSRQGIEPASWLKYGASPALPEVPIAAEGGLADFAFDNWFGLLAPGSTPAAERLSGQGIIAAPTSPADAAQLLANEFRIFGEVIRAANIRAD